MNRNRVSLLVFLGMVVSLIVTACGGGAAPATSTIAPTTAPTTAPTNPPEPTAVLIEHITRPSAGSQAVANAHDNDMSASADEKNVRSGDEWRINRFERPFTADDMTYLPQVDITGMSMTQDADWYYVQIQLAGANPATNELDGIYGVEFDLNVDGKTEVLVLAAGPLGADWTTDAVTVHADTNGDIGGMSSRPDDIYTGNGYETIVFDSGTGEDPDLAWARGNAERHIVEIAFKKSVLRDYPKWMWNPLASATTLDPTKFYFNDTLTEEHAGSPNKGSEYYPLKGLAGFDNTCRVPAGFQATGAEPLGCLVAGPEKDREFTPGSGGYPT